MNREPKNRSTNHLPDFFDDALELEETVFQHSYEEPAFANDVAAQMGEPLAADPTFFDEQVINVPIIDPPDMKNITSYPDAQIYDHLFSTDDDFLLDEEAVEDVITSIRESAPQTDIDAPADDIDEIAPVLPDPEPVAVPETETVFAAPGPKPSKKPPVKRAGMPKKEEKAEEPAVIKEPETPLRKKPRVKRAGETAAAAAASAATAAVSTDAPPIALMEVGAPKKAAPKRPEGHPDAPHKKPAGKTGAPHKRPTGSRPAGQSGSRPEGRTEAKAPSQKKQRPKPVEDIQETRKAPEEKTAPKKRPFSPLEKMKKKLAEKWS